MIEAYIQAKSMKKPVNSKVGARNMLIWTLCAVLHESSEQIEHVAFLYSLSNPIARVKWTHDSFAGRRT